MVQAARTADYGGSMQLNNSQQLAVSHNTGAMLVLAGPGSGKTAVITNRIVKLIDECKVSADRILIITFSRAAALEMKQRFERIGGGRRGLPAFGTFHAVFFKILKEAYRFDTGNIVSDEERFRYLSDIIGSLGINMENKQEFLGKVSSSVSFLKTEGIAPESGTGALKKAADHLTRLVSPEVLMKIYAMYRDRLKSEKKIDFEDMMLLCLELFEARPDVLEYWQEKYEYILIDEFQDINRLQYALVKLLAQPQNNIFAVGDDDQSIYRFRGATPRLMFEFEKDFRGCRRTLLSTNYRSHDEILGAAARLISNNKERFKKKITGERGPGGRAEHKHFENLDEENDFIAGYLASVRDNGGSLSECAILYRMNHEVSALYRKLVSLNIPCRIHEHMPCIFDHWIAQDLLAYLRIAAGEDERSLYLRIINRPKRYVPRDSFRHEHVSFGALREINSSRPSVADELVKLEGQLKLLKRFDMYAGIKFVRMAMGYNEYICEYAQSKGIEAADLYEVLDELEQSARGFATPGAWQEYMREMRDKQQMNEQRCREGRERSGSREDAVELMTFHSSKGLEFDTVFIIDFSEGYVPPKRAETCEDIEEERRVLYVAVTRARKELYICEAEERLGRPTVISRFAGEIFGYKNNMRNPK